MDNIHQSYGQQDGSKRPQTSHGRDRKNVKDGVRKREGKTVGLGETSKNVWQIENDDEHNIQFAQPDKVQEKPPIQYNFDKRPVTAAIKRPG